MTSVNVERVEKRDLLYEFLSISSTVDRHFKLKTFKF